MCIVNQQVMEKECIQENQKDVLTYMMQYNAPGRWGAFHSVTGEHGFNMIGYCFQW